MAFQYSTIELNGIKTIVGEPEETLASPADLLVGFHGAESTPENMLVHGNRLALKNAALIYPQAPLSAGDGLWSWWADGPGQAKSVFKFLEYTGGFLDSLEEHFRQARPGVETRICLWGFSQGGGAALVHSLLGRHEIHKTASVCGFLPEISEPDTRESYAEVLGIFGENDDVVPSFLAEHALDQMKAFGHTVALQSTAQGHEISEQNLVDVSEFLNR